MFRLISSSQSLRPALLQKAKNTKSSIIPPSPSFNLNSSPSTNVQFFNRTNASVATNNDSQRLEAFITKPNISSSLIEFDQEALERFGQFKNQIGLIMRYEGHKNTRFTDIVDLIQLFQDPKLRLSFSSKDLVSYAYALNNLIFNNRTKRLANQKNRDSDQKDKNSKEEITLRDAIIKLADATGENEFSSILDPKFIKVLFRAMSQYKLSNEMMQLWENGINDSKNGQMFLQHGVLASILPVAYETGRFSYEEIVNIYDINTKNTRSISSALINSMGKIALEDSDYSRALDYMETLLSQYESQTNQKSANEISKVLGDLHLSFVGSCKDIKIAKQFFDRIIVGDLPYPVKLKVSHVQSLLENCYENNEPFETIENFWKQTLSHYSNEMKKSVLNSRYSILNNTFFQIFFKTYYELNQGSLDKLSGLIKEYSEIRSVDEIFINTIISNYSWKNKEVFDLLVNNYDIYQVERTPVSYRVSLKKCGEIAEVTNDEIVAKWTQSLKKLDDEGYTYIPIADWAALRDSTILSPSKERKLLYLKVLNEYKNFIQDERSLVRFLNFWYNKPEHSVEIKRLAEGVLEINCDTEVHRPQFVNLRENVNFQSNK